VTTQPGGHYEIKPNTDCSSTRIEILTRVIGNCRTCCTRQSIKLTHPIYVYVKDHTEIVKQLTLAGLLPSIKQHCQNHELRVIPTRSPSSSTFCSQSDPQLELKLSLRNVSSRRHLANVHCSNEHFALVRPFIQLPTTISRSRRLSVLKYPILSGPVV